MSAIGFGVVLVVIWVLLWGTVTPANVLSGVVVATFLVWVIDDARHGLHRPSVRIIPIARFVGRVLAQVARANLVLAREVVTRGTAIRTGIVVVPLPLCSDGLLTVIANTMALTPGTMPVYLDRDPTTLHVHVLHLDDVDQVRLDVQELSELAVRAFGSDEAIRALEAGRGSEANP